MLSKQFAQAVQFRSQWWRKPFVYRGAGEGGV